jgi:hypothetical protein
MSAPSSIIRDPVSTTAGATGVDNDARHGVTTPRR